MWVIYYLWKPYDRDENVGTVEFYRMIDPTGLAEDLSECCWAVPGTLDFTK